jgi:flagellar hook protein FlgE
MGLAGELCPMMKTALTGVMSASRDLGVISNNLANAMTVGFKRSTSHFVDVAGLSQNDRPGLDIGQGAMTEVVRRSDSQGPIRTTSSALDIALVGAGHFTFADTSVTNTNTSSEPTYYYSRAGQLQITPTGQIVDRLSGRPLMGQSGGKLQGLNVASGANGDVSQVQSLSVDTKGVVSVTRTNGVVTPIGVLAIAHFNNEDGLKSQGGAAFLETDESGPPMLGRANTNGLGSVQQGALEDANVDMTSEMLRMIRAQQAYNGNARALQTGSEMLRSAIENLIR